MKKNLLPAVLAFCSLALVETAAAQTPVFVQFPMTANNQDNAAVRSAGVIVNPSALHGLVLSNGLANLSGTSLTTAQPPYSAKGQAMARYATGADFSTNSTTPPGTSTPKGVYYQQFSITATAALRVDSLGFNVRVSSSANGRMALTWSTNGYATDSMDFSTAKGPVVTGSTMANSSAGGILSAANNGRFGMVASATSAAVNYAFMPQDNAANPKDDFHFAFNNSPTGLTLANGQTLTVRIYYGIGSNTPGRYILIRNITFKSRQTYVPMFLVLGTRSLVSTDLGIYPNPAQNQVVVPHAVIGQDARVTVYNAVGAQVATVVAKAGTSQTTVRLDALPAGLYLVEYTNGLERSSARVVKE